MLETLLSNRTVGVLWEAPAPYLLGGPHHDHPPHPRLVHPGDGAGGGRGAGAVRQSAGAEPAGPVLHLGHPRHTAAGAAFHHLLRPAQRGHHAGRFPGCGHRLCLQRGCLLRRDHARRARERAPGPAGSRLLRGHELVADHAPHRSAAGPAHRRACPCPTPSSA